MAKQVSQESVRKVQQHSTNQNSHSCTAALWTRYANDYSQLPACEKTPALSPPVWTHWSHYSESDREKTKPADSYWHTRTVRYLHTCFQYYKTTCSQTEPKQYQRDKHIVFHWASLFNKRTTTIKRADFWTSLGVYVIMHMWCAFQIETKWVYLKATHWIQIHILPQST